VSFERDLIASWSAVSTQILENQITIMEALQWVVNDDANLKALRDAVAATSALIDGEDAP
jgi:hypothetical protein